MTTSAVPQTQAQADEPGKERATFGLVRRLVCIPAVRELLIIIAFCLFTSTLTWPYVTRLRDAVVDTGDPYLIAWILWWDYHQTFTNPLHLFDANTFYPLRYTLAFSEHSYGIALLFFPLYALGLKPLVVLGSETQDQQFDDNLRRFLEAWTNREAFTKAFGGLDNAQYVDRLVNNAGISIDGGRPPCLLSVRSFLFPH